MRNRLPDAFIAIVLGGAVTLTLSAQQPSPQGGAAAAAQAGAPTARTGRGGVEGRGRGRAPAARLDRIAGHPNLNGVRQAISTANWNVESHSASATAFSQLGAIFAIPAGQSVII